MHFVCFFFGLFSGLVVGPIPICLFLFIVFYYYSSNACFVTRDRKGVDLDRKERRGSHNQKL